MNSLASFVDPDQIGRRNTFFSRMTEHPERVNKRLKVLVIGEISTGKTTLVRRNSGQLGVSCHFPKIPDFACMEVEWDEHTSITLELWDLGGQERYGNMTHVFSAEAHAAFLMFDVTRIATLDLAVDWKKEVDNTVFTRTGQPIPCILLGNKIDLCPDGKWEKTSEEMQAFSKHHGFIDFFLISVRNGINTYESARALATFVLDNKIEPADVDWSPRRINISEPAFDFPQISWGCC
jgi:small GTP-binding protein